MFAATKTFASIVNRRETSLSPPAALLDRLGHGGALSASEQAAAGQVLHGTLSLAELRDGFFLHRTDVTYLRSMTSRFPLSGMGSKSCSSCKAAAGCALVSWHCRCWLGRGPWSSRCANQRCTSTTAGPPRRADVAHHTAATLAGASGPGDLNARQHLSMVAWGHRPGGLHHRTAFVHTRWADGPCTACCRSAWRWSWS